ncbi:MAG: hypothetical protein R3A12_16590 [Ignavibacteria bacterium]
MSQNSSLITKPQFGKQKLAIIDLPKPQFVKEYIFNNLLTPSFAREGEYKLKLNPYAEDRSFLMIRYLILSTPQSAKSPLE